MLINERSSAKMCGFPRKFSRISIVYKQWVVTIFCIIWNHTNNSLIPFVAHTNWRPSGDDKRPLPLILPTIISSDKYEKNIFQEDALPCSICRLFSFPNSSLGSSSLRPNLFAFYMRAVKGREKYHQRHPLLLDLFCTKPISSPNKPILRSESSVLCGNEVFWWSCHRAKSFHQRRMWNI